MLERKHLAWLVLAAFVVAGACAPLLAPRDPTTYSDPSISRNRPPLSQLVAVDLDDGRRLYTDQLRHDGDHVILEDVERQRSIPLDQLVEHDAITTQTFLLGTDRFGRDVLSRLLWGARVSLLIGLLVTLIALTVGLPIGTLAALGGPVVDGVLMRIVDVFLAFPWIFLIITLAAMIDGSGLAVLIVVLGGTSWMAISRVARAMIRELRDQAFVTATRGLGAGPIYLAVQHLIPHALPPILIQAALGAARVVLAEAALSFIGLGIQPPEPSWGNMINDGRTGLLSAWWVAGFPTLALIVTVLALSEIAETLRHRLTPYRLEP
ncbi:MAG: ABC transporter permease [Acidobacteriota bacterium]